MRQWLPWWARIGAKLVLSRLPAGYGAWRRINLFAHGAMHQPEYAFRVFQQHLSLTGFDVARSFVVLEVGPGDSLSSAVVAAAHGASETHLVDVGPFATSDMTVYRDLAARLRACGLTPPELNAVSDIPGLLRACRASYRTGGLVSLREIPTASVDFAWSHAVLEHVRRHEFLPLVRELRRVMRPGGVSSHVVDLKDHLGGALNNMRVPSRLWEAEWMARSGFYTNRLRMAEMLDAFRRAGFDPHVDSVRRWESLPTRHRALAAEFKTLPPAELLVEGFNVVLRPA
jgi:SAM-dependent methyltransferase